MGNQTAYDMIYLVSCGVNQRKPDTARLADMNVEDLFHISRFHYLEALVGTVLKNAGVSLPKEWSETISKAMRKNILFDAERTKLLGFMESQGIWYLPLKGIVLKDFYPGIGMRQMSDNDILFDADFADKLCEYMKGQGYEAESVGLGNHDVYKKPPVYNFEMHRSLHSSTTNEQWAAYYEKVKERLVKDEGNDFSYHFTDEDFYIYMITHEYKHYKGGGTGLRSLTDVYVYLKKKESSLDFAYIQRECEKLGITDFERQGRILCKRIFDERSDKATLAEWEQEMLTYYLTSGVYGTTDRMYENKIRKYQEKTGNTSKLRYMWNRLFPPMETYRLYYPFFYKHKWLLPIGWLYRTIRVFVDGKRRRKLRSEMKAVRKA